jgi:hypothetical protein
MPTITFKLSETEARDLRRRARAARCTVSAYLRANAVGAPAAAKPRKIKLVRHPVSGLLYDVSGKDLPKVSNEEVKAMLADFP